MSKLSEQMIQTHFTNSLALIPLPEFSPLAKGDSLGPTDGGGKTSDLVYIWVGKNYRYY